MLEPYVFFFCPAALPEENVATHYFYSVHKPQTAACSAKCIIKPTLQLYFYFSPETFEAVHLWVPRCWSESTSEAKKKRVAGRGPLKENEGCACVRATAAY